MESTKKKKSLIKIILITIISIVLIVIIGVVALVTFVDPNRYKPLIIKEVNEATGRNLSLNGNISWKLYPNIGLHIEKLSLSNPDGFPKPNLVEVQAVDLALQLMPLLHSKVIVDSLTVDGLDLGLVKKGQVNNWTFKPSEKPSVAEKPGAKGKLSLDLSSLILKNATITYDDLNKKTHQGINNFDFKIKTGFGGVMNVDTEKEKLTFDKVNFNFDDIVKGNLNLNADNFSDIHYTGDLDLPEFSLNKLLDKFDIAKSTRKNKPLLNKFALKTKFTGDMNNINLNPLDFNFPNTLKGKLALKIQNFANPHYTGNINIPGFSLNNLMVQLGMKRPDIPNGELLDKVSYHSQISGGVNNVNLSQLALTLPGSVVTGNINVNSISPLKLTENLSLDKAELSDFVDMKGFKMPISKANFNGNLNVANSDNFLGTSNGNQNIYIQNLALLGFSINNLIHQLDQAITTTLGAFDRNINIISQVNSSIKVVKLISTMQDIIAKAKSKDKKDWGVKTDLGSLKANMTIRNGVLNPANYELNGPSVRSKGNGSINLKQETWNYTISTQLLAAKENPLLNYLVFPYTLQGKISNMNGSLDWASIQKQMVKYLISVNSDRVKSAITDGVKGAVDGVSKGAASVIKGLFGH